MGEEAFSDLSSSFLLLQKSQLVYKRHGPLGYRVDSCKWCASVLFCSDETRRREGSFGPVPCCSLRVTLPPASKDRLCRAQGQLFASNVKNGSNSPCTCFGHYGYFVDHLNHQVSLCSWHSHFLFSLSLSLCSNFLFPSLPSPCSRTLVKMPLPHTVNDDLPSIELRLRLLSLARHRPLENRPVISQTYWTLC